MQASPPSPGDRRQRGFTLLEVMCAFAMLSLVISLMVTVWSKNIDTAIWAIDKREMREVADTIFGRILFEQQDHRNGDEGTLAVMYGQWAHLPQHRAERYEDYRYSLSKVEYVAAGAADPDEGTEVLGASTTDTTTTGEEAGTPTTTEEDTSKASVRLIKFTMKVFKVEEPDEPLITLTRFLRPPDIGTAGTTGTATTTGTGTTR